MWAEADKKKSLLLEGKIVSFANSVGRQSFYQICLFQSIIDRLRDLTKAYFTPLPITSSVLQDITFYKLFFTNLLNQNITFHNFCTLNIAMTFCVIGFIYIRDGLYKPASMTLANINQRASKAGHPTSIIQTTSTQSSSSKTQSLLATPPLHSPRSTQRKEIRNVRTQTFPHSIYQRSFDRSDTDRK